LFPEFSKSKSTGFFVIGVFMISMGLLSWIVGAYCGKPCFSWSFCFAVGEMVLLPNTGIHTLDCPKRKGGLYMGANFWATFIGAAFSGVYTWLMGRFEAAGNPRISCLPLLRTPCLVLLLFIFSQKIGQFQGKGRMSNCLLQLLNEKRGIYIFYVLLCDKELYLRVSKKRSNK
jgi:hypothetical protein